MENALIHKPKLTEDVKENFWEEFFGAEYQPNTCCCCGHNLDNHIDELDGWRCHSLGRDFYQCECYLRKNRYDEGILGYDLNKRIAQYRKEEGI